MKTRDLIRVVATLCLLGPAQGSTGEELTCTQNLNRADNRVSNVAGRVDGADEVSLLEALDYIDAARGQCGGSEPPPCPPCQDCPPVDTCPEREELADLEGRVDEAVRILEDETEPPDLDEPPGGDEDGLCAGADTTPMPMELVKTGVYRWEHPGEWVGGCSRQEAIVQPEDLPREASVVRVSYEIQVGDWWYRREDGHHWQSVILRATWDRAGRRKWEDHILGQLYLRGPVAPGQPVPGDPWVDDRELAFVWLPTVDQWRKKLGDSDVGRGWRRVLIEIGSDSIVFESGDRRVERSGTGEPVDLALGLAVWVGGSRDKTPDGVEVPTYDWPGRGLVIEVQP